jgi:hypothetical protein
MPRAARKTAVPKSMQIQLARLFGEASKEAKATTRTPAEWRRALRRVLADLDKYLDENVTTDEMHRFMLATGLWAASEALKEEDFWPGYTEGLTRFALSLLGDYPDHRKQRLHGKRKSHYSLRRFRSVVYSQTPEQKVKTLFGTSSFGVPKLSTNPITLWREYVARVQSPSYRKFLQWYRKHYPQDYAAVL